jgi:hypothetical protein
MKIKTEVKTEDLDVKELKKKFDESVGMRASESCCRKLMRMGKETGT